jgi:two-component system, NtrC family, response regulator AtoC
MPAERIRDYLIEPAELPPEPIIFGSTAAMREIRSRLESILSSDLPVLIHGESGTGKEVIARFLHFRSGRRDSPFVKINCAAIPVPLLESELFGYEKAAFTGADQERAGFVEIAKDGTLFLDDIDDLDRSLQGKLLHLLQDGSYTRIGGAEARRTNVRIICATRTDLKKAVEDGRFREDLFYRVDVLSLRLSALRDRKSDIPQVCSYLLDKLSQQFGRPVPQLNPATLDLLQEWNWPGNLRELENWIARAVILGDDPTLGKELRRQIAVSRANATAGPKSGPLKEASRQAVSVASYALILKALEANHWNRRKTADELHMSYRSLLYKLREAGVPQRRRRHMGFPP